VIEILKSIKGNVFSWDLGFVGYLAGKQNYYHSTAFEDIRLSRYRNWLETEIPESFEGKMHRLMDGLDRDNVNAFVVTHEKKEYPQQAIGPFKLAVFSSGRATKNNVGTWMRDWPENTLYSRPAIAIYLRNNDTP